MRKRRLCIKWANVFYCVCVCVQYSCYDCRTICTCPVSRFTRQHNGSNKRSCCKIISKLSALIIIEQAVIPLWLIAVFCKAYTDNFFTRGVHSLLYFFFPRSVLAHRIKPKWVHSSLTGSRITFSLPNVPRCLPFYRDISKAFWIS